MKRSSKNKQKTKTGMPSAVVLSILIHAGLFLLAGLFVVFTILPPKEASFEPPPPVKRPKMPLRKIQMKVKKPSKPKASAKLTAVVKKPDLHEISFPDLPTGGMGSGIGGANDIVSFVELPDFDDDDGILGKEKSIGNDFEGTYYDFKRNRSGQYTGEGVDTYKDAVRKFLKRGWSTAALRNYYRSPYKRYATCFVVPPMSSSVAPSAFGEEPGSGFFWMVHYKGKLVHTEDITFRFWGSGDMFIAVRVDKKIVLADAVSEGNTQDYFGGAWSSKSAKGKTYNLGYPKAQVGDWITLKAGEPLDMEVILGDDGVYCCLMLAVEVKDVEYETNRGGGPILPAFKTTNLSHDLIDQLYMDLTVGDMSLTNGPVFRDY